jgi:hypothetical protein
VQPSPVAYCGTGHHFDDEHTVFHFDLTDWKQLKFFFYLTDVNART